MRITDIRERRSNGLEPFLRGKVRHPDVIAASKHVVVVLDRNDVARKIDVPHIVSIEDLPHRLRR